MKSSVIPKFEEQLSYLSWIAQGKWSKTLMEMSAPETRKKIDKFLVVDLDGDGVSSIATTKENGGWILIWFENPGMIYYFDGMWLTNTDQKAEPLSQ